jgi:SAM-dependent methyltransferase
MMRYTAYDPFAWLYNRHWTCYAGRVLPALDQLGLGEIAPPACVLDLCCGTGQLAAQLHARGYQVTGLDGSEAMIALARENAPACDFIVDDARTFDLPPDYDAVVSVYDSLNHIMTLDELAAVFRRVYAALKPEGLFIFDMNLHEGHVRRGTGSLGHVDDDYAFIGVYEYDPATRRTRLTVTLFRFEAGQWQRQTITLIQACYEIVDLLAALESAGFAACAARDACEVGIASEADARVFIVGKKARPARPTTQETR